ncbi:ATP synthase F0 subunit C [Candidatus Poribacteria bacterium]|nr:ATP synthase F0 subunit C [Candidatus Poribacteria bacterium]MYB66510.1 ATP synthase F0 subunit C [Candidatus Poribacteria bacterium]
MIYLAVLAFGVTLGLPIAVIFASRAQGSATSTALEGIARQPESAAKIQTAMIIGLALIESLIIYALLMFFMLYGKLPEGEILQNMIDASTKSSQTETAGE